ncbi:group III truncated hemoglobin [Flavobacterium sp. 1355]|jgi:hemoglobin|uniref:group III truncated hemoglobin n=1 Tax=Flavobacterium sp. 1355 TaxID=2806571 RepID=UPI001B557AE4|nr:group III truncated hemoglobin [Flavobacterium sp. 1355]MBP1222997.1 hemoglobin [Flavobacterium sp. 1355]
MKEKIKTDIKNRQDIKILVDAFYGKVQTDPIIGYLFTKVANVNWEKHLPIMYDFWDNILFHSGNFEGNPMMKHRVLNQKSPLTETHFKHWNKLWKKTVDDLFEGTKASEVKIRAQSISKMMMNKVIE